MPSLWNMKKNQDSKAGAIDQFIHRYPHLRVAHIHSIILNRARTSAFYPPFATLKSWIKYTTDIYCVKYHSTIIREETRLGCCNNILGTSYQQNSYQYSPSSIKIFNTSDISMLNGVLPLATETE